jgi:hypothetical protein
MRQLNCGMCSVADADNVLRTRNGGDQDDAYSALQVDCPVCPAKALASLVFAWQACTVALAQALFDELALTAEEGHVDGAHYRHPSEAPKYQSTPMDVPPAHFTAPTQPSQLFGSGHFKHSPHLFAFSSQLSQSLYARHGAHSSHLPYQSYPVRGTETAPRDAEVSGDMFPPQSLPAHPDGFPTSQVVLCSSHPPAVQATLDLCGAAIKVSCSLIVCGEGNAQFLSCSYLTFFLRPG